MNAVLSRSDDLLRQTRERLRLFVPSPAFNRALSILRNQHVCIITGAPGVGKTMLADVLMYAYAVKGIQAIAVSEDIVEAEQLWHPTERQIFHYDDFLGMVRLVDSTLRKNEDRRLVAFLDRIRRDPLKRFLLTTRDYILNDARLRYERLRDEPFENYQCILNLSDYTKLDRAQILYNHLYYSSLPDDARRSLLLGRTYLRIIDHPRYTPRLVSLIVSHPDARSVTSDRFAGFMLSRLSDPGLIWRHIFEDQLTDDCQAILLVMGTLPDSVMLDDLRMAFERLKGAPSGVATRFRRAVKTLEVTFLKLVDGPEPGTHKASIADPSLKDFVNVWLSENPSAVRQLVERSAFFEQCSIVGGFTNPYEATRGTRPPTIPVEYQWLATGLLRTVDARPLASPGIPSILGFGSSSKSIRCHSILKRALDSGSRELYLAFETVFEQLLTGDMDSFMFPILHWSRRLPPDLRLRFEPNVLTVKTRLIDRLANVSDLVTSWN